MCGTCVGITWGEGNTCTRLWPFGKAHVARGGPQGGTQAYRAWRWGTTWGAVDKRGHGTPGWHCGEFRGTVSTRQSVRSVRCYFTVPPRPALTPPPALRPAPVNQLVFQPVGQSVIARSLPVLTPPPAQASKQISRHAGLRARPLASRAPVMSTIIIIPNM